MTNQEEGNKGQTATKWLKIAYFVLSYLFQFYYFIENVRDGYSIGNGDSIKYVIALEMISSYLLSITTQFPSI